MAGVPEGSIHDQALQIPGAVEDGVEGGTFEAHRQEAPGADGAAGVAGAEQQVPVTDVREEEGKAHHKADEGSDAGHGRDDSEGLDSSASGVSKGPVAAEISHKFISAMTVNANRKGSWMSMSPQNSSGKGSSHNGGVLAAAKAQMSGLTSFSSSMPFMPRNDADGPLQLRKTSSEKRDSLKASIGGLMRAKVMGQKYAAHLKTQSTSKERAENILASLGSDIRVHRGRNGERQGQQDVMDPKHSKMPFLIFHPYTSWRLGWDVLITCLLFYSLISVPVMLSFDRPEGCSSDFWSQRGIWYFDFCMDMFFISDMILNLRTAFFESSKASNEPVVVTSSTRIILHYASGFLWIDLISSIPFDLILLVFCTNGNETGEQSALLRSPKVLKLIRLVRVLRLLRISRLKKFFSKIRDLLKINPGVLRLIQFISAVVLLAHYNGCLFFFIAEFNAGDGPDDVNDWSRSGGKEIASSNGQMLYTYELEMWEQYLVSLYWATTTLTTTGWGDITPLSTPTMIWCIFVIIEGGFVFSYMVGNMAGLINKIDPRASKHKEKMEVWDAFMHSENLPLEMRQRIRNFSNKLFRSPLSKLPDFAREELSKTLLRDITAHTFKKALHAVPMFKGLDEQCLTELALALQPIQMAPGEHIYREGDSGDCMFFLHSGFVELSILLMTEEEKEKNGVRLAANTVQTDIQMAGARASGQQAPMWQWVGKKKVTLRLFSWIISQNSASMCFGENCLTTDVSKRLSTAVASSWVMLFKLDRSSLKMVARKFPQMEKVYQQIKRKKASKLMKSVHKVIQAQQTHYKDMAKLFVHLECAINLPRMDGFLGSCDAYCTIQMGLPENRGKKYTSTVQYSTFNPVWQETFMFPVRQQNRDKNVVLSCQMFDYDVIGDNEDVGSWTIDATDILWKAIDEQAEATESHWFTVSQMSKSGVPLIVKGHNNKPAKVKISLRAVHCEQKPKSMDKKKSKKTFKYSSFLVGAAALSSKRPQERPSSDIGIGFMSTNKLETAIPALPGSSHYASLKSMPVRSLSQNGERGAMGLHDRRESANRVMPPAIQVGNGNNDDSPKQQSSTSSWGMSREEIIADDDVVTVYELPEKVSGEPPDEEEKTLARTISADKGRDQAADINDLGDEQMMLLQHLADRQGKSLTSFAEPKKSIEEVCFQYIDMKVPNKDVLENANWRELFFGLLRVTHVERQQAELEMCALKDTLYECQQLLVKKGFPAKEEHKIQRVMAGKKEAEVDEAFKVSPGGNSGSASLGGGLMVDSHVSNVSVPVTVSDFSTADSRSTFSSISSKTLHSLAEERTKSLEGLGETLSVKRQLPTTSTDAGEEPAVVEEGGNSEEGVIAGGGEVVRRFADIEEATENGDETPMSEPPSQNSGQLV